MEKLQALTLPKFVDLELHEKQNYFKIGFIRDVFYTISKFNSLDQCYNYILKTEFSPENLIQHFAGWKEIGNGNHDELLRIFQTDEYSLRLKPWAAFHTLEFKVDIAVSSYEIRKPRTLGDFINEFDWFDTELCELKLWWNV